MNGDCKSYKLNSPMKWDEFKSMPDDIKITYVKLLRQKFNVPGKYIAMMLGTNAGYFSKEINRLGISEGKNCRGRCTPWDKDGFYAWWHGVDTLPTPVPEAPIEAPVIEEAPVHFYTEEERATIFGLGEVECYVEEDIPFEAPDPVPDVHHVALCAEIDALKLRIDELLKANEELKAVREKDKDEIAWLRNERENQRMHERILEAQMDVVRLIFGGRTNV